ncbi:MAG: hypothetical protein U0Y10_16040 [Spirosomataceae bacterium]
MNQAKNLGYDPSEIQLLKDECKAARSNFVYVEDSEFEEPNGDEYAHFQFVGTHEGAEVIYDAIMYTLQMHHSSIVYETAERRAQKAYPLYVPLEMRDETHIENEELDEEVELVITELIQEIEENEEVKVLEHVEIDKNTDYGIELDICLNVPEITDEVIRKFINDFNQNTLQLDPTLYSFKTEDEDE